MTNVQNDNSAFNSSLQVGTLQDRLIRGTFTKVFIIPGAQFWSVPKNVSYATVLGCGSGGGGGGGAGNASYVSGHDSSHRWGLYWSSGGAGGNGVTPGVAAVPLAYGQVYTVNIGVGGSGGIGGAGPIAYYGQGGKPGGIGNPGNPTNFFGGSISLKFAGGIAGGNGGSGPGGYYQAPAIAGNPTSLTDSVPISSTGSGNGSSVNLNGGNGTDTIYNPGGIGGVHTGANQAGAGGGGGAGYGQGGAGGAGGHAGAGGSSGAVAGFGSGGGGGGGAGLSTSLALNGGNGSPGGSGILIISYYGNET